SPRRRRLLRFAAGGLAALALPGLPRPARAQPGAPARLDERFSVIDAGGSNVLVFDAGDGLVLVDSGTPAHADTLLATLDSLGGGVRTLFNTHWHAEQLGANAALGQGGAHIIAHAKTRQRLATDWYLPHEQRYHKALPAAALPAQTIHDKGTLEA